MEKVELKKKIEDDLIYWLPLARGEVCSPDLYLLSKLLPAADVVSPLDDDAIKKIKQAVKENPVFERPEVKEEFDDFFKKLGIIED